MSLTFPARTRYNQTHKHAVLNRRVRTQIWYSDKEKNQATHSNYMIRQIVLDLCCDQNLLRPDYLNSSTWWEKPVIHTLERVNEIVEEIMQDAYTITRNYSRAS